jgi:hypothetical protein
MNKTILLVGAVIVIAIAGGGAFFLFGSNPPDNVPRAQVNDVPEVTQQSPTPAPEQESEEETFELVSFQFIGYGPGKVHPGEFTSMRLEGETFIIDAASVETGIEALNTHLKTDDFFDVENHPQITFEATGMTNTSLTGILTMSGVAKEITVPATITDTSISIDFLIDISNFGISFAGVDKEVQIMAELRRIPGGK